MGVKHSNLLALRSLMNILLVGEAHRTIGELITVG